MRKQRVRLIRIISVITVAITLFLGSFSVVFAASSTLKLTSSTPENGDTGMPVENAGVKLYFDGNVTSDKVWEANKKQFTLVDSKGKKVPAGAYRGKEEGYVLILAQPASAKKNGQPGQLSSKTKYTLEIGSDLTSVEGHSLGKKVEIGFTTTDTDFNNKLNMGLMVVMMGGMVVLMVFSNVRRKKAEFEAEAVLRANPYKLAKEKGISVEEARALIEKKQEKIKKDIEAGGGTMPTLEEIRNKNKPQRIVKEEPEPEEKENTHKVSGPRRISEGGSTYKTGRKALAEEKKAKAEAAKKERQNQQSNKKKGSKGQQKKKKKR